MGNFLVALGKKTYTHRWLTIGIWLFVLITLGVTAKLFIQPLDSSLSIPGTAAQKTLDRYNSLFPGTGKGSGRIVLAAPHGKTLLDYKDQITQLSHQIAKVNGVTSSISPFVNPSALSHDNRIGYISISLSAQTGSISKATLTKISSLTQQYSKNGLEIERAGDLIDKTPGEIIGTGEISGVVLALVVLLITLGSLLAAGMPLIVALFAIGISMAGLFSLSHVVSINSTTPALAVMLGLAVGIDYSLFIISRFKAFLLEGHDYKEAIGRSIATAGNAVLFAAATVVIALGALSIVNIPFLTTMGLTAAATVAITAFAAVTLLPAILGLPGKRIFGRKTRGMIAAAQAAGVHHTEHVLHTTVWYKWGRAITRHPIWLVCVTVILLVIVALPVFQLRLGLPTDEFSAKNSTEHKAYQLISQGFGAGANGPLLVVVEGLPQPTVADKTAVTKQLTAVFNQQVAITKAEQQAAFKRQAAQVTTPQQQQALQQEIVLATQQAAQQQAQAEAQLQQKIIQYTPYYELSKVASRLKNVPDVSSAMAVQVTDNGTKGVIEVIPSSGPSDPLTTTLINYLRDPTHQQEVTQSRTVSLSVTGATALQNDINKKMGNALPEYLLVVIGLSFILLMIAFRSILVPIKATLGFLLSVLAMFGGLVAVFQWGWFGLAHAPGPIISFIPIIGIGILFGLAMDYEFFLVSGMHEAHLHTKDAQKAVLRGFSQGSKVVLAAAFIMVSVFAGFISNSDSTIQALGFGLALGIFVDAFLVRMTIVPAVMTLLGNKAWWLPRWLNSILPHLSIEGKEETKKSHHK